MDSKSISLTISLLLATNSYAALDEKDFAKCAALEGDLHRLECSGRDRERFEAMLRGFDRPIWV